MFIHNLRKRGVAMVEYAVLLAFVTAIGGLFMDDSKLNTAIADAIDRATYLVANGELKSKYKYNANVDPNYKEYTDFTNELINKIYDSLLEDQINKGTNQQLSNVWIKKGQIIGYSVYNDQNGKNGGYKELSTPINLNDLIKDNNQYSIYTEADSHLCFDTAGNITNFKNDWNEVSRIYISNTSTPNKWSACLTFNKSDNAFSGEPDYWMEK